MTVNTANILFIVGGAFEGLDRIIRQRSVKTGIGFGAEVVRRMIAAPLVPCCVTPARRFDPVRPHS